MSESRLQSWALHKDFSQVISTGYQDSAWESQGNTRYPCFGILHTSSCPAGPLACVPGDRGSVWDSISALVPCELYFCQGR